MTSQRTLDDELIVEELEGSTPPVAAAAPEVVPVSGKGAFKLLALAAGFIMATVDTTIINVAGPAIQRDIGISLSGLSWVVDGYTLPFASLLLLAGSLANKFGAKTMYLTGMVVFAVASLWCGLAPNGAVLIAGRLVQGFGAALFMPSSLTLLTQSFPAEKRARMIGLWASIVSTSAAVGPVLGGVLVDTLGWRSIFIINLPIAAIGIVMTKRLIHATPRTAVKLSLGGHALTIVTLAAVCFALIEGPRFGWGSAPIIASVVIAAIGFGLVLTVNKTSQNPVFPRELFARVPFTAANVVGFLLNFGMLGMIFMFGLFVQNGRGASPLAAGLQMLPMWGVFVFGNMLFARISEKAGNRKPLIISLALGSIACLSLVTISPGMPYWVLAVVIAFSSLSIGVTVPAMTASLMASAGAKHANVAGSTLNANRQMGALVGVAVVGLLIHASGDDWYRSMSWTFLMTAICYGLASLVSWRFVRPVAHND